MHNQIEKALQALKDHFGTAIFSNPRQFKAALADMPIESDAKKVRNLLNIAICDMKAYTRLESGLANSSFTVDNLVSEMVSDYMIDITASRMAIECVAGLLGYKPKSPPKSTKQPKAAATQQIPQTQSATPAMNDPILKRVFIFLEDGDWDKADEYCERVLDANPENTMAYVGKLCAELKVKNEADLANCKQPLDNMLNYKKAIRYADTNCQSRIAGYNQIINERIKKQGLSVGSVIKFNKYDWRILESQGDKALILTEALIEQRPYNGQGTDITWETCSLRKYLNGEFLQRFTKEQQGRIIQTRITNNDNQWYGTKGGNDTNDSVFLLSLEEVVNYFGDSGQLRNKNPNNQYAIVDQYNAARIANRADVKVCWWWLRSPGSSSSSAASVSGDGRVNVDGSNVDYSGGVRPALWLNL